MYTILDRRRRDDGSPQTYLSYAIFRLSPIVEFYQRGKLAVP